MGWWEWVVILVGGVLGRTCQDAPLSTYPFCNATLPVADRVEDLYGRLTLEERLGQMLEQAYGAERLGMSNYTFASEGLHGVWCNCANLTDGSQRCPTQFPTPAALGATFDRELWRDIAAATALEARGLINGKAGVSGLEGPLSLSFYAPNINIMRDPRWGRTEEVPGEDPVLASAYGKAFVQGLQGNERYLSATATCKHFAGYSLEGDIDPNDPQRGLSRFQFDAFIGLRDLAETYLPAFQGCVEAGTSAVMCSYNAVNGVPMCMNRELLVNVLRGAMGFDGVISSDCGAISRIPYPWHNTSIHTIPEAVVAAVDASVSNNCGPSYAWFIFDLVRNGTIPESHTAPLVNHNLALRFKLGLFDSPEEVSWQRVKVDVVDSTEHRALALKAAQESIVLLQNNATAAERGNPVLPLNGLSISKLALVGPMANASKNLLAGYHGQPPFLVSPLEAFESTLGKHKVVYEVGCKVEGNDSSGIEAAVRAAQSADVVVVGMGLCGNTQLSNEDPVCVQIDEKEGTDRGSIALPSIQTELLRRVAAVGKPTVGFVMSGGPVDTEFAKPLAHSLLWAGYGGQSGGRAVADVILGQSNPSGRLAHTVYPAAFINMSHYGEMSMRTWPGRSYRYTVIPAVWPFGHGLSFTPFNITVGAPVPDPTTTPLGVNDSVSFPITVRNDGEIMGDVVLLAFVKSTAQHSIPDPPIRQLFDFTRVKELAPGERAQVHFTVSPWARSLFDEGGRRLSVPGNYVFQVNDEPGVPFEVRNEDNPGAPIVLQDLFG